MFMVLFMGQMSFAQKGIPKQAKHLIEQQLEKFETFVIKAKEHGATHVRLTENIPPSLYQFDVEGDPYPAWYIYHADLLKEYFESMDLRVPTGAVSHMYYLKNSLLIIRSSVVRESITQTALGQPVLLHVLISLRY
jgi:hypothetical protein